MFSPNRFALLTLLLVTVGCSPRQDESRPWRADHHVHLATADLCSRIGDCLALRKPAVIYASDAIKALDEGNVIKGVVFSGAYLYGMVTPRLDSTDLVRFTRLENQFTATEAAKYPDRLIAFLSVDPLEPSAIEEIQYWKDSTIFHGLKLHLTANRVDLGNPDHHARVVAVLKAAADAHLPMVIHMGGGKMDSAGAERFIATVLPAAGESWVQLAHAAGGLPARNRVAILAVFAAHIERDDPATRRLLFDLSYVPAPEEDSMAVAGLTRQLRRIGMKRLVFGSDFDVITPVTEIVWLKRLGFSPAEMDTLRGNCAPWAC